MNLKKAIEIQEVTLKPGAFVWTPDLPDAMRLGLEALKRIQEIRLSDFTQGGTALPGETPLDDSP